MKSLSEVKDGQPIPGGRESTENHTRSFGTALFAALAFSSPALTACKHQAGEDVAGTTVRSDRASATAQFSFDSLDARPVSTGSVAGRPTVVAFVTTWDLSSQAQVDFLVPMSKADGARVNYLMVALQEPQDRELVEVYASHLRVTFPVAIADKGTMEADGPFGELRAVPTIVILDRAARVVWRHVGLARPDEIREGLRGL